MKKQQYHDDNSEWLNSLFILWWIILSVWIISWVLIFQFLDSWGNRGTFWDMFWAVNSLFSWLALAWIIYTIFLQRKELSLQRKELELNRKELSRSAKAQENSEKELRRQADNLKATARLNALSTLMNYYSERAIKYSSYSDMRNDAEKRYEECKNEIEIVLNWKS